MSSRGRLRNVAHSFQEALFPPMLDASTRNRETVYEYLELPNVQAHGKYLLPNWRVP